MSEVNRKNSLACAEAIKALQEFGHAQQTRIDQLNGALSAMTERITALEHMLLKQKAASIGTGATVKQ